MRKIFISVIAMFTIVAMVTGCVDRSEKEEIDEQTPMMNDTPDPDVKEKLPPDNDPPSTQEDTQNKDAEQEQQAGQDTQKKEDSAVMSRDWDQISSLSSEKLGWGPGGPVDKDNRSQGAIVYQDKYGKYDADFIAPADEKKIYLTFDEGYENGHTATILDTLKEKNVSAVFFVTGHYVKSNPDLIQRMIDEGHIVGNHTWGHPSMPDVNLEQAEQEVLNLHNYVKENFDYTMNLFRFPSGEFNEQNLLLIKQLGYKSCFWSFAYKDWVENEQPDPTEALNKLKEKIHPGAIYLLHAVSSTNSDILPQFIDEMRNEGYEFCNYNDMNHEQ